MPESMSMTREKSSCEIIFESEAHHQLFCALFPEKKAYALTASSVLREQSSFEVSSLQDRLNWFTECLKEDEKKNAAKFLATLEQLRLSLIVNAEQVDFCFSLLFPTPKNKRLQELLHFYLESPLKEDMAQCYWESLGRLKEKQLPPLKNSRIFVKARSSSFLFCEWAQAHQYLQESTSTPIEFWELPYESLQESQEHFNPVSGQPGAVLSHLAGQIRSSLETQEKQLIAFGGAPHALLFLESKLKSLRVPFESLFSHRNETQADSSVLLFPFQALPHNDSFKIYSYIDESFYAAKEQLFLTEGELFTLMNGGFSIPRISTDRLYMKTMVNHLQTLPRSRVFLSNLAATEDFPNPKSLDFTPDLATTYPVLTLPRKTLRLSATQLETYSTCPSLYLVRHRLKLRPIQSLEDRYALIFGSSVHLALESYFQQPEQNLESLFIRSLESSSSELNQEHPLFTMMLEHFKSLKEHFILLEDKLKTSFGIKRNVSFEKSFELKIEHFSYLGKIDRVIEREDGSQLLIDYKTGNVDFSPKHLSEGNNSQALLYILSVRKESQLPVAGVLFYDLKKGELKRGIFEESWISKELRSELTRGHVLKAEAFEQLLREGTVRMLAASQKIENGDFTPTPTSQECERCEAPTFCRKGLGYV